MSARHRQRGTGGQQLLGGLDEPAAEPPRPPAQPPPTTSAAPRPGRRLRPMRTIRARLAVILVVPAALLIGLAGVGVGNQIEKVRDANAVSDNVELVLRAQDLIHSLQRERALTTGLLGGEAQYRPLLDAQRRATDENQTALNRLISGGGPSARTVRTALERLSTLGTMRGAIDSGELARATALDFYTNAIVALGDASADPTLGKDDLQLRRGLQSLYLLGDAKEAVALERGQLNGVFAAGSFSRDDYLRFTETRAAKLAALAEFQQVATARRNAALQAAQRTPQALSAASYERQALNGLTTTRLNLSAPRWSAAMTTVGYDMREIQRGIGDDVRSRAFHIKQSANRTLLVYLIGAGVAVAIALLLWLFTFRSIIRPLRMLTGEATEAAEHRLPGAVARIQAAEEPAAVVLDSSRSTLARRADEFAEVAEALDNLQRTAVRLAAEQAVMRHNTAESLANLGRRNQNLVRRQLGFISALEREESDPNALANLFELDHLATRMRRNAESLLVLVGESSPRRWSSSVQVGDVLRSAFAEVEDYRRVVLRRADEAKVQGAAAAEISHLLAELVENALSFSPPDQEVEVQARVAGSEYHIAIVDQGIGMPPEAMAVANARLRGEESFLMSPSRDLGHYVVGRLAQRLGAKVWLHDSPLTGVTARVTLPGSLLVSEKNAKGARRAPGQQQPAMPHQPGQQPAAIAVASPPEALPQAAPQQAPQQPPGSPAHQQIMPPSTHGDTPGFVPAPPPPGDIPGYAPATSPSGDTPGYVPASSSPSDTSGFAPVSSPSGEGSGFVSIPPGELPGFAPSNGDTYGFIPGSPPPGAEPMPEPPPLPAPRPSAEGPATTRNGLVKRQPKQGGLRRPVRPVAPAPIADDERRSRTPDDVRSMLNTFRSGVQRAEQRRNGESE